MKPRFDLKYCVFYILSLASVFAIEGCTENKSKKSVSKSLIIQPGIEDGKDAVITFYTPDVNRSTEDFVHGFSWTIFNDPVVGRGYISFDINNLSSSTIADSAILSLTVLEYSTYNSLLFGASGNNELVFQRIIEPWKEDSITWFNSPETTSENEIHTQKLDSNSVNTILCIDVTKMLNDALEEQEKEFGISFKLINEQPYSIAMFASSEHDSVAYRPKLEIYYKE